MPTKQRYSIPKTRWSPFYFGTPTQKLDHMLTTSFRENMREILDALEQTQQPLIVTNYRNERIAIIPIKLFWKFQRIYKRYLTLKKSLSDLSWEHP